jgi:drug/metabolite transporter (DMT)-like permease
MSRPTIDVLLFCLLATFWGGSFVAIKFVVADFPPAFGAMLRVGLAVAVFGAYFTYEGRRLSVAPSVRRRMWLAGLFAQGLPFALLFWGERKIAPGLAGIINGTVPLWTFLFGLAAGTGEGFTLKKSAGLLLGFAGIAAVCAPVFAFGGTRGEIQGTSAVFLMAFCYAVGSLLTRSLLSGGAKADFRANLFHQHCASLALLVAFSALTEKWPPLAVFLFSGKALVALFYLGFFSTALAFMIYFHLIREWGAVRASAVTYVAPIIALFWDYVFFRNVPVFLEIVGVAAILSGVVLLHSPSTRKA